MKSNYSKNDLALAKRLAGGGLEMDEEIGDSHAGIVKQFPKSDYFNLVVANALTWTGHAIARKGYYPAALQCLENGTDSSFQKVQPFAGRLGGENLLVSLQGWREIILYVDLPDLLCCSILKLKLFQDKCLRAAESLKKEGALHGVGPWLFCAPFKIILAHRKSFWDEQKADELLMPLGIEVIRGMKLLIRNGSSFVRDIDTSMITEEEGGLFEGLGTVSIVQSVCREIANISDSLVIHINSGLFRYGRNELE